MSYQYKKIDVRSFDEEGLAAEIEKHNRLYWETSYLMYSIKIGLFDLKVQIRFR